MSDESFSMPVIYLGQSSRSVGAEIDRLSHILGGICGPLSTFVNDEITPTRSANDSHTFRMQKCAHTLTERTEFCAVCSANSELLQEVVVRRILEKSGSSSCNHQICVVSDNYTQFGTWSSSIVMEYLQQETSYAKNGGGGDGTHGSVGSGGVLSVLVKPPMGCSRGLECLYSVLSAQHSLDTSHATLFRGLETCYNHTSGVPQHSSVYNTACDLYPILCSTDSITTTATGYSGGSNKHRVNSSGSVHTLQSYVENTTTHHDMQYHLWPLDIVRTNSKIIDTRSSLAALLKKLLKTSTSGSSNKTIEYNPLRAVSANVHALHLAYSDLYATNAHIMNNLHTLCITSANYAQLTLPSISRTIPANPNTILNTLYPANTFSRKKCMKFSNVLQTEHELHVAFTHATPGISWPYRNTTKNSLHVNGTISSSVNGNSGSTSGGVNSDISTVFEGLSIATPRTPHTARSTQSIQSTYTTTSNNSSNTKSKNESNEVYPYNAINTGTQTHTTHNSHYTDETDTISVMSMGSARTAQHKNNSRLSTRTGASSAGSVYGSSVYGSSVYGSSVYSGVGTGSSGIGDVSGDSKECSIGSIVFDSPYGVMDCTHICDSARDLLNMGAYRHLFGPAGSAFTSEELYDAIDVIESYYMQ